jgi:catechol 2,3-dioxygenase-like lactoylglutathione lyase family enzyme
MKIKVTTLYVDDQNKALRFYTEVLGFVKKTGFSQGPYRWLTVAGATKFGGWQRLVGEYAKQFGVETPDWPPNAAKH